VRPNTFETRRKGGSGGIESRVIARDSGDLVTKIEMDTEFSIANLQIIQLPISSGPSFPPCFKGFGFMAIFN